MAVYAIGDLQGCYDDLQRLLELVHYEPESDILWFTGDLVNRGPDSLKCLRFVKSLGERAITVLGNHDLSLLAVAAGYRETKTNDTIGDILSTDDRDDLLEWLRYRPLIHYDTALGYAMVHAGLPPQWSLEEAIECANEIEMKLRGKKYKKLLRKMYGDQPNVWSVSLKGSERRRFIINCFTRMRYCTVDGELDLNAKYKPDDSSKDLFPWFNVPNRKSTMDKIVFGHWSTLGCIQTGNVFCLDSGCVWGGCLTAMRLDTEEPLYFSVNCNAKAMIE